jgi:hypothetical protein
MAEDDDFEPVRFLLEELALAEEDLLVISHSQGTVY